MNRFEEFEIFVRVVDAGSLTAAATQMGLAKSAVSRRLKALEQRLDVQLMTRTTRQITLTDSGRALYERAVNLLTDWKETESAVRSATTALSGVIKMAAPVSFGVAHLGPAIHDFRAEHPDVAFDVDFNERKVDLIAEGRDLAIRIGALDDSGLIARKLAPINFVACASPDFLKVHGYPKTPLDLEHMPELRFSYRPKDSWTYTGPRGDSGQIKMVSKLSGTNGEFLRDGALAGQGVTILPCFIIHNELRDGSLVDLLPDYEWDTLSAYAVYPPTRHLSTRVRAFVDFLVTRYKGQPYWDIY